METIGEVLDAVPQQFQQPSRLSYAHDTGIDFRAADNSSLCHYLDGLNYLSEEENRFLNDDDDDSLHNFREFLEGLDAVGHEMFKKLVSKVEKDVPIERLVRETLRDLRGRPASDMLEKFLTKINTGGGKGCTSTQRGVNGDISTSKQEESKHKLERFKVKTVNVIGLGVVKEEGK